MRRTGLVAAVVPLVLTASGCWLHPRVGPGNTNFAPFDPALSPTTVGGLVELWSTDLTTAELVVGEVGSPLAINEDVYVAATSVTEPIDAMAAALDVDTGAVRWTTPLDVPAAPSRADLYDPVWVGGNVLVPFVEADPSATAGHRFSVDAATGVATEQSLAGGGHLTVVGDRVVSQSVTAIRQPPPATVTRVNWGPYNPVARATSGSLRSDYAVVGDRIAWTDGDTGALGYSADCGGGGPSSCLPDWTTTLAGRTSSPTAVGDDRVVYADTSGTLSVLDMATGAVAWEADLGSRGPNTQATVTADTIVVGTADGGVVALPAAGCGAATCTPLWSGAAGHAVTSLVVAQDVAYAATSDGSILAFDMAGCGTGTCDPLVEVSVGAGRFVTGGPIVHSGRVLAGTADGRVVAFGLRS